MAPLRRLLYGVAAIGWAVAMNTLEDRADPERPPDEVVQPLMWRRLGEQGLLVSMRQPELRSWDPRRPEHP
jgi:hypothetical protein